MGDMTDTRKSFSSKTKGLREEEQSDLRCSTFSRRIKGNKPACWTNLQNFEACSL